jgi:hypothetical protein
VGTLAGGLDRLDRHNRRFFHYNSRLPNSIRNDYISTVMADSMGNVWAGTGYGVERIQRTTGAIQHFIPDPSRLSSTNVIWLFMDSRKRLWAGTREGLDVLNPDGKTFQSFSTDDGLPENWVRYIAEDSAHRLWISTANGLSRITVVDQPGRSELVIRCRNFHEPDGLQAREFNERAGLAPGWRRGTGTCFSAAPTDSTFSGRRISSRSGRRRRCCLPGSKYSTRAYTLAIRWTDMSC